MNPQVRRFGLVAVAVFAAVAALACIAVAFLHLPPGERWLAGKVEAASAQAVELDGFHVSWPFTLTADHLRLKDAKGTWLTANAPILAWDPARLWRRVVDVERLAADRIEIERLPVEVGAPRSGGLRWPKIALNLGSISAPVYLAGPLVGEPLDLDLAGTFQMRPGGGVVDVHVRAEGGGIVRLAGTAGQDYLDLRWYLRITRLDRWSRLAGMPVEGEVNGSGTVAGRLPQAVVSGTIETGNARVGGASWEELSLSARLIPERDIVRLALSGEVRAPRLDGRPSPLPLITISAAGDLAMDGRLHLGMARLTGDGLSVTGSGVLAAWGRQSDLRLEAKVDDLADYAPAAGRLALRTTVSGDLLALDFGGRIEAWGGDIASGNAILDRLLGANPSAATRYHVSPNGAVQLTDGSVSGAGASLSLDGQVADRMDLWARLRVPELAALAEGVAGNGTAWGRIGGKPMAPVVVGVARVEGLALARSPPAEGDISFDLALPQGGTVTADLRVAGRPVDGSARLVLGQPLRIRDLVLHSDGSQLVGELAIERNGVRGRLKGSIPELKAWQDVVGHPVTGRVDADAVLDPSQSQSVRLTLGAANLLVEGVRAGRIEMKADVTGLMDRPSGKARVTASNLQVGGLQMDQARLNAGGDGAVFHFDVAGVGDQIRVSADGTAHLNGTAGNVALDRFRVKRQHRDVVLVAPARIEWDKGRIALAPAALAVDGGKITLAGWIDGKTIAATGTLAEVPLDVVALAVPEADVVGTVAGTVALDGTLGQPAVQFDLTGRRIGLNAGGRPELARMAAEASGEWRAGRLSARASFHDGDRVRLLAEGRMQEGIMEGGVEVAADLARLTEVLPLGGHSLIGKLSGRATILGRSDAPIINGEVTITNGRYENSDQGTVVAGLGARLDVADGRVTLEATGSDGGRGRVAVNGSGDLAGSWQGLVLLDRFTLLRRDEIEAIANGRLEFAGHGRAGRIGGRVAVPRAEIDIGRLRGGGAVTIPVVEINRPGQTVMEEAGAPPQEEGEAPSTRFLTLDVALVVEHAFVRGRGLDSEWHGELGIAGTEDTPLLTGRLEAARGDYQFLGKSFQLTPESAVSFGGGDPSDPALDVLATARATDITAQVEITGTAHDPQLAITSDPALPPDEVLARILFGREAGSLSAFQQIKLAQLAASGLTGKEGGIDPIGGVRGLLGLDVLDVGGEEAGGPTLSAGKYIGRDTFVRVEQGTQGLGAVTVERELGGGLSVETEIGQQSGGGVGLTWRRNY